MEKVFSDRKSAQEFAKKMAIEGYKTTLSHAADRKHLVTWEETTKASIL